MAVLLAEGVGGSIDDFAQQMTDTAHRLGMTESSFVNPNGLPADGQISSARDLAILARALLREFPEYSFYWHVPAIRFGRRIVRNYNPLLGRYAGADGMKTGFICASGFNLVATATRGDRRLIAVVLGAPSSPARAMKAAQLLESGFAQNPLSWLMPSLGAVEALAPIDAAPPDLKDSICGPHRKRPPAEDDDADAGNENGSGDTGAHFSTLLSALRAPVQMNLLSDLGPVMPVVVYTGPTRTPAEIAKISTEPVAEPEKKKIKRKTASAKPTDAKSPAKPADKKPAAAKPAAEKKKDAKPTTSAIRWTPTSPSALATSPPPDLKADAPKPAAN
jgi:D-alanyl-D-alanine carboxypeptidase